MAEITETNHKNNMKITMRRGQLIAPFGVGAIHILKGSRAVVTGGLDFWFKKATPEQIFRSKINEPRLQARLGVDHFRLPPGPESQLPHEPKLVVPLFRFPTWYVCPHCLKMDRRNLGLVSDATCRSSNCTKPIMRQVGFAAVCDHGHLQDFPWREWVHREKEPACDQKLSYHSGGSGSLSDIEIKCECGKKRDLGSITRGKLPNRHAENNQETDRGSSFITSALLSSAGPDKEMKGNTSAEQFFCQGGRPWLDECIGKAPFCERPLRGILINATNVHYAQVKSTIWIPAGGDISNAEDLRIMLDRPDVRPKTALLRSFNFSEEVIADKLIEFFPQLFSNVDKSLLSMAIRGDHVSDPFTSHEGLSEDEVLRYPEYLKLQEPWKPKTTDDFLEIRIPEKGLLPNHFQEIIASISLVDRLRETRVLSGFTRLVPDQVTRAQSHLWKKPPNTDQEKWLPAALVFGEGIFIRFSEETLQLWEANYKTQKHINALHAREQNAAKRMGRPSRVISARFILLHTLSHVLMRRLSFECGYNTASLRERLYVSERADVKMGGILIYTASGDCEGSMGGLVRMGEPKNLARLFDATLEDIRWCSSDPVCTDAGRNGGQGIDGLNIAACHCCALLPENSCEHFNCYLDRGAVADFIDFISRGKL